MLEIENIVKYIAEKKAAQLDETLRWALIGSVVQDFKVEKIPGRKRMVLVTLVTSAENIRDGNVIFVMSPLKLRVKI